MSVQFSFSTKSVARNKADLIPCSIGLSLDEQCCADNTNSKTSIEDFNDKNLVLKLRCIKTRCLCQDDNLMTEELNTKLNEPWVFSHEVCDPE